MFIDEVQIKVISGKGGDGLVSWRREKYIPKGGPWGGNGGDGGDVYFIASEHINTLSKYRYKKILKAEDGERGMPNLCHGKNGKDLYLEVPVGTLIKNLDDGNVIVDLDVPGKEFCIVQGGRGGYGNAHFCSSTRQAPGFAEIGDVSEEKEIILELKLVADIGIIGIPSAGKSTLISKLSDVKPKIGDYPFTTLTPNLGVLEHKNKTLILEDVPGLIHGASKGKGLGIQFLKHIERTGVLLHLLDLYRLDAIFNDYEDIRKELGVFSEELSLKQEIIVFSKADLLDSEMKKYIVSEFQKRYPQRKCFIISAVTGEGIEELKNYLIENIIPISSHVSYLGEVEGKSGKQTKIYNLRDAKEDSKNYTITYLGDLNFSINGKRIEQIVRMTDFQNYEAVMRIYDVFEKMGILREIEKQLKKIVEKEDIDNSFFFEGNDAPDIAPKISIAGQIISLDKMKYKL